MKSTFEEALGRCDSEPVHIPGAIQPCGALLAFDDKLQVTCKASANLEQFLGVSPEAALQQSADALLGQRTARRVLRSLENADDAIALSIERRVGERKIRLQLIAYRSDNRIVVELEPLPGATRRRWLATVNSWLTRLIRSQSQADLLDQLVQGVQDLTGHERVMVYQFDDHWNGTVVAEYRTANVDSFLDHRFPASDIPPQVRALYAINPVRSIPDARATPVPLVPHEAAGAPTALDLSGGILRAVSPIHLRYLANMGVVSSLSLAIHGSEHLWGLVACHAVQYRPISPQARDAALSLVQVATQRLFLLQARADARYLQRVLDSRELISEQHDEIVTPAGLVEEYGEKWLELFHACGVGVVYRDGISRCGQTPDKAVLKRLASRLAATHRHNSPWFSAKLNDTELAQAGDLAGCHGLLALPLTIDTPPGWLMFFRLEKVVTHRWAGDATAPALLDTDNRALSPRRSFATWVEQVKGQSRPWLPIEIQAATDLAEDLAIAASILRIESLNERLEEANRHLSELAHTDALTQVWNRYRMEQALEAEIAAAVRYGRPCSIILLDIDHFKQFNDQHGHEMGDKVLVTFAREIKSRLRLTDYLGRWGGEEFVVLAASSSLDDALHLAQRLHSHITRLEANGIEPVTFSAGVAEWRPGDTRRSLVDRADRAMYRAKESGRNRICHD